MSGEKAIQRSACLIAELAQQLTMMLGKVRSIDPLFHVKYLLCFLVYAKRQVEAICILVGLESHPIYAEQAGQLLRVLMELSIKLAWMMHPYENSQRDYRAWQIEKASTKAERLPPDKEEKILEETGVIRYEESIGSSIKGLPNLRQMADAVGPDDYQFYRWESSRIHLSTRTLDSVIGSIDEQYGNYNIQADPPDDLATRALVLCQTLRLIDRIAKDTLPWLGLDTTKWTDDIREAYSEVDGSLRPLIELTSEPLP